MMSTTQKDLKGQVKQSMKYWLVDITLTSGEELQFYVSALNEYYAHEKADSYAKLLQNESLLKFYKGRGFKLLP